MERGEEGGEEWEVLEKDAEEEYAGGSERLERDTDTPLARSVGQETESLVREIVGEEAAEEGRGDDEESEEGWEEARRVA